MKVLNKMKRRDTKKEPLSVIISTLLEMYAVSIGLLLILAFLLLKMDLTESTIKIGIIAVYIIVGFTGGFLIGKQMIDKKYLWGIATGLLYVVILLLLSFIIKKIAGELMVIEPIRIFTTMFLCMLSGMAGGMLS